MSTVKTATWRGARPKGLARLSAHAYQQASWTRDDLTFEQHLPSRSCTCEAGEKGHWCKHLTSAFVAAFVDQLEVAQTMEPAVRRKLLKTGTHQTRPDIELALMVAEYKHQEAEQNATPPAPAPEPPPGGGQSQDAYEEECAAIDTQLARAGREADREWLPRRSRRPDAARIAGWQDHSAEVVAQIAAEAA